MTIAFSRTLLRKAGWTDSCPAPASSSAGRWLLLSLGFLTVDLISTAAYGEAINTVSGTLVDAGGRPMVCVQVQISGSGVLATDELGRFAFGVQQRGSTTVTPQAPSDFTTEGITEEDVQAIIDVLGDPKGGNLSAFQLDLADVNDDGILSAMDSLILTNYINGGPPPARSPAWLFSPPVAGSVANRSDLELAAQSEEVNGPAQSLDFVTGMIGDLVVSAETWHCPDGCGNGDLDGDEDCDDGGNRAGDGCTPDCLFECGNGVLDLGELCDDGNRLDGDGCPADCGFVGLTIFEDRFQAAD